MNRSKIRIKSFGTVTGLIFENGGYAEVLLGWPEITRLLEAWKDFESSKSKPNRQTLEALTVLSEKAMRKFPAPLVVEIPIAQKRAKITPIITEG